MKQEGRKQGKHTPLLAFLSSLDGRLKENYKQKNIEVK
jgi:hypothetical protein